MNAARFRKLVWGHYRAKGRHDLPWRLPARQAGKNATPYRVLVSEIMLQQTQVARVVPKFQDFTKRFPSLRALARASAKDVLAAWSGLGYNRRALALKRIAEIVTERYRGRLPSSPEGLLALPGIGPNTAGSIAAFAFNKPAVFIETNIRAVFLHHFFADRTGVHDKEILPLIEKTLDRENPREWYWALMDYGVRLKQTLPNPSRRSKHHAKQPRFEGSRRQLRGQIVKALLAESRTLAELEKITKRSEEEILSVLAALKGEKVVAQKKNRFSIA